MYSSSRDHVLRDPEPDSNFLQMVIMNFIFSYIYLLRTKNIYVEHSRLRKILIFIYESSRVESSEMRIRNIFSFVRKIFIHDAFDIRNSNGFFIYNIIIFKYVLELYD